MARPFIEFLQTQALAWRTDGDSPLAASHPDVAYKILSEDVDSGASSLLLRYPRGWSAPRDRHLDVDEELLVLDGALHIDGERYARLDYGHLPAGYPRAHAAAPDGAVVLAFYSGRPTLHPNAPATPGGYDRARLVSRVGCLEGGWGQNFSAQFPPGAGRKFLRRDPHDGEESWILGTMPLRWGSRREQHPVVEEMYLLSGELVSPRGRMQPGAYFWRPPGELHGPFGSLTGCLMFFRTKGGPLSTQYCADEIEFDWYPPHRPILPAHLAGAATAQPALTFAH